jgi:hypothetical protein
MPQLDRIRDKNVEVTQRQERLSALNEKIDALALIDENEESVKLLEMEEVVPSSKELARLVIGVRSLAGQSGLAVVEMELSPGRVATQSATVSASKKAKIAQAEKAKEEDKNKTSFELSLRAKKINQIQKFLKKIEKAKRLLGIETIGIKLEEKGVYVFNMELVAPFREVKSSGDVVAEPLPTLTSAHETVFDYVTKFVNYTNVAIKKVRTGVSNPFR